MLWILVFIAIILGVWVDFKNTKKKHLEWQLKNNRAYAEFLKNDLTMTDEEKQKAEWNFMFWGEITQPYSGRKFEILPKD